jgi:hypothetical protein
MTEMIEALVRYGCWLLFAPVFGRQACLPELANLLLVAAGAFGQLSVPE